jgi:uncharacterized membrane protein YfcA
MIKELIGFVLISLSMMVCSTTGLGGGSLVIPLLMIFYQVKETRGKKTNSGTS